MVTKSLWNRTSHLLAVGLTLAILVAADDPAKPPQKPALPFGGEAAEVAQALQESWPDHPEWVDMLVGILDDEPMGTSMGWFRTAVAQTRFDWAASRKRFDRDGDGRVARAEFPGDAADFSRLDRDHDKALTAADFDFSGNSLASSPGGLVFMRADADGNGKVTREEINAFFKATDSGGEGFLSLSDLQEAFSPPPPPARSSASASSGRPSKATLVRGLFRQEVGSLQPGPRLDESAPDFTLKTNDGKSEITLSRLLSREARRAHLRQFHLRTLPQPVEQRRKALPPLQRSCDLRHGLRPRRTSHRGLANGEQRPGRCGHPPANDI